MDKELVPLPVDPVDDRGAKYQESVQSSLQHIDQVDRMDAGTFFKRVASVMKETPPAQHDAPALEGAEKARHRARQGVQHHEKREWLDATF